MKNPSQVKRDIPDLHPIKFLRQALVGRYILLMTALLLMMAFSPLIGTMGQFDRFYVGDLITIFLLAASFMTFVKVGRHAIAILLLATVSLVLGIGARIPENPSIPLEIAGMSIEAFLLGYIILLVSVDIFTTNEVDANTLCGSVSVYLLLGGFFAMLYSIVYMVDPANFAGITEIEGQDPTLGPNRTMIYFSLVTLTTLGYGDIHPTTAITRSITNVESIIGQLYLTVLVARLVGQHLVDRAQQTSMNNSEN